LTDHPVVSTTKPVRSPRVGLLASPRSSSAARRVLACLRVVRRPPSSASAASEPRGALDRGMWIVLRRDWRWFRRRPCHLGWRHADAHNDPISVASCGDPTGAGICSSPPFDLSHGLVACHWLRIVPSRSRGNRGPNLRHRNAVSAALACSSRGKWSRRCACGSCSSVTLRWRWLSSCAVAGAALRVSRGRQAAHDVRTAGRSTDGLSQWVFVVCLGHNSVETSGGCAEPRAEITATRLPSWLASTSVA
jgi:hypothetical protein